MSKYEDAVLADELESNPEPTLEAGPIPTMVPNVGGAQSVVARLSHCTFCGGRLHFVHASDFSRNTTHEKASCPECGLDARQVLHRLQ